MVAAGPSGASDPLPSGGALKTADGRRSFLRALADRLRDLGDPEDVRAAAADLLGKRLGATRVGYADIDPSKGAAVFGQSVMAELAAGRTIQAEDAGKPTVCVPLIKRATLCAVLFVDADTPRHWTDDEIALIEDVAERTFAAIERAEAEKQLRESGARYRTLFESIDEGFCIIEFFDGPHGPLSDYIHVEANPAYERHAGIANVVGQKVREMVPGEADGWVALYRDVLVTGKPIRFERELVATGRHLELAAFRIEPASKKQVAVLFQDVTARKRAENALLELNDTLEQRVTDTVAEREDARAQIHELQKLETIGQLTGGIAHDFNNLLTPIVGSLDLVRRKVEGDERSIRLIAGAQQSAERARTLISRLLTFARRQHLEPRTIDIGEVANGLQDLIERTIGPQIKLQVDVVPSLAPVRVDPNQLELSIVNLVVNSRDAMPGGGQIGVKVFSADRTTIEKMNLSAGDYICFSVSDTGCGMDAETLRRAIEPFYSTKGVGKGTGLGLSMVHGLAAQSGGALRLQSAPGQGTTATLCLPVAEGPPVNLARQDDPTMIVTRALSILLVDDEDLVRMATADMLSDLGHHVRQAESGVEALEILRRDGGIDLLVTDYAMPGLTGVELARAATAAKPDLKVLLVTGYADLAMDVGRGLTRLAKPFRHTELASRIAEVLGER